MRARHILKSVLMKRYDGNLNRNLDAIVSDNFSILYTFLHNLDLVNIENYLSY